jgi:hypothetical protein
MMMPRGSVARAALHVSRKAVGVVVSLARVSIFTAGWCHAHSLSKFSFALSGLPRGYAAEGDASGAAALRLPGVDDFG